MCDKEVTLVNDVIQQLSSVTGVKYSDEQLQVLNHKGGMCIVACAGAGKTSVLVSLLAKRVSSGEIHDTSKLLVTTYSVAGREELQVRINKLLNKMGIPNKIEIRTLHSAYFKILKSLNMLGKIGTGGQRLLALQQAIKECGERLDDEEVQQLDSLISFQINNMMPDNVLYGDVNFNLEMSLETYSKIRKTFAQKKAEMGFIDFDDLQLQLYMMMKKDETVREYVKSLWDYFYIDEFQDVSKLQYEILRMMLKDPSKLVVIGDDDQCLIEGTQVQTEQGIKNIEDVSLLDRVQSGIGRGKTKYCSIDNVSVKEYTGKIIKLTTESGRVLQGTPNHVCFARMVPEEDLYYTYLMYKRGIGCRIGTTHGVRAGSRREIRNGIDVRLMQERADKVWVLKASSSKEDALYWESYFAYKYSIPMYRFVASDKEYNKTALTKDSIIKLFSELNSEENAKRLLSDLCKSWDYPNRVPQAEGERCKLNYSMFTSSQIDSDGIHKTELSANTSNMDYIEVLKDYLSVTDRKASNSEYIYKNARYTSSNLWTHERLIKDIVSKCGSDIYLEVDRNAKFNDNKYMEINIGNIVEGMYVPVIDNDKVIEEKVVSSEILDYCGKVYDLSVNLSRNFNANGILVHNCIYQWRGADPSIILNICGTYDIERFILSTNYRCGGEIVSHANTGIQNNSKRHVKQMTPFNSGGEINLIKSCNENYYEMSRKAFNKIRELILDGVAEEDISVLCRNNAHGVILNNMLLNEGIIHRASEDVRFHNHFFVKDLMACVEMGNNTYNFNYVSANLWKIVPFLSAKNSAMIGKIMKDCGCNFAQALKSFLIDICYVSESAFDDDIKRMQFDTKKYYNIRLTEETKAGIVQVYNIITDNEPFEACQKMTQLYCERTIGFLYKSRDAEKIITGIKDYLNSLLAFGYDYYANTIAKAKNLSEFEIEPGRRCINLSTMHGSKGKEWKHVIMLGVDGYSCPGMKRVSTYKDSGRTNEDISVYVEQERRLHYVAMTRAKEELTIICDYNNLSPFLYEAFDIEHKIDDVNTHIVDWAITGGYKGEKKDKYFAELEKSLKIIDVDKNESDATNTSEETDANIVFNENFSACIVDETEENKNEPLDMNDYLKDTEEFAQNCGEAEDEQHF